MSSLRLKTEQDFLWLLLLCLLTSTILMQTTNENGKVKIIKMTEKIVAINTTNLEAADCLLGGGA